MKTNLKKYAQALYQATKEATDKEVPLILGKFVRLLARQGILSKSQQIIFEFSKHFDEEEGYANVEAVAARELAGDERRELIKKLENFTDKKVNLFLKIDKTLIGGLSLKIGDKIYNQSLSSRISNIKQQLV